MLCSANGSNRDHAGFALFNVHERIQLSFGPEYGVQVFSEYGKGTTIGVTHPLVTKE